MAAQRQQQEPDTTQTLPYWMGRVDATLGEMKAAIENFGRKSEAQWLEFDAWRRSVDNRLQEGASRFEDHTRRLDDLEENCEKVAGSNVSASGSDGKAKFGQWEWFRDSYLEKGVYIILSLALYKLIDMVITYWANTPK